MTIGRKPPTGRSAPDPDDRHARRRLLDGLSVSIRERGYQLTRLGDIVRHANTSRRTFYETFSTKDDCIAALLDRHSDQLCAQITSAIDATAPWDGQVRRAVAVLVESLAAEPALSRAWVRDMAMGGRIAADARRRCTQRLAEELLLLGELDGSVGSPLSPLRQSIAFMAVSGVCEYATDALEDGDDVAAISEVAQQAAVNMLRVGLARR